MIQGLIGRPGSGKSYTLTAMAREVAAQGRNVYANYAINSPNCYTFTAEQLLDLPPGLIVIDEAHLWFPARMALKLPPSWLAMLSQTRKNGWDLLWAAQHENRVDRIVRDISSYMWLCNAWWKMDGHPALFTARCWEPETFRQPKKSVANRRRFYSPANAKAYDTFQRLEVAAHAQSSTDAYAPPAPGRRRAAAAPAAAVSP